MNKPCKKDETLMARAALGSDESFETVIERHAPGLLSFIKRMVGNHHVSEELFQDVVGLVWKNRANYNYPSPFKPWLFKIAVNRCREEFRRRDAPKPFQVYVESVPGNFKPPEMEVVSKETSKIVNQAVECLAEQQRAVVVLRIWHGLSYRQIGQVVDASEATVRGYMHHALKKLRLELEPHGI